MKGEKKEKKKKEKGRRKKGRRKRKKKKNKKGRLYFKAMPKVRQPATARSAENFWVFFSSGYPFVAGF